MLSNSDLEGIVISSYSSSASSSMMLTFALTDAISSSSVSKVGIVFFSSSTGATMFSGSLTCALMFGALPPEITGLDVTCPVEGTVSESSNVLLVKHHYKSLLNLRSFHLHQSRLQNLLRHHHQHQVLP